MSTIKKGNAFEDKVFRYIEDELSNDRLHVSGKRSEAHQKKGYYSKERESEIIIDISIETFLPGASEYSLLTVIECKDYSSSVPVNDVEEFHSKVQQIAGDNVKAMIFTSAALQRSALSFAKSKGIGVIRYLPDDQVKLMLHCLNSDTVLSRRALSPSEFSSALLNQDHQSDGREFYACDDKYIYPNLFSVLKEYL